MNTFDISAVREFLGRSAKVVITSHHNPDGDAIGACLALYHYLLPAVGEVHVIVPNDYPGFLKWLPGNEQILVYNKNAPLAGSIINEASIIFCLDYNSLHRTGDMAGALRDGTAKKVLIDHHPEPVWTEFDFHFSEIETSSTSELIYRFIRAMSPTQPLVLEVAENLFAGIMTDTGSFSYSCNYPETFLVTAELIRAGVNPEKSHRMVYDTYSEHRLRLLGYCLSEKLTILPEYHMAYIALSKEELDRFRHRVGDTEGVVNYALSMEGIVVAALLTERRDRIRISFRSKGSFAVNQIARDHFHGGGHSNAAGGDSFDNLEDTIARLIGIMAQYKAGIDRSIA